MQLIQLFLVLLWRSCHCICHSKCHEAGTNGARKYLAAIGVKTGADGIGAHSFRHTLADRLRSEAELLDNQIAVCLGHSTKSTTGGYGELSQGTVNMLRAYMEAVRFDGVNFDHLLTIEEERTLAA